MQGEIIDATVTDSQETSGQSGPLAVCVCLGSILPIFKSDARVVWLMLALRSSFGVACLQDLNELHVKEATVKVKNHPDPSRYNRQTAKMNLGLRSPRSAISSSFRSNSL